jgi:hypothetical protein
MGWKEFKSGLGKLIVFILLLFIVIFFITFFYLYLRVGGSQTAKEIKITNVGCRIGQTDGYYVSIKNLDMASSISITPDFLSAKVDGNMAPLSGCTSGIIPAGGTVNCNITLTGTAGSHRIKVIGPANTVEEPVNC